MARRGGTDHAVGIPITRAPKFRWRLSGQEIQTPRSLVGRSISNVGIWVVRQGWRSAVRSVSSVTDTRWGWRLAGRWGAGCSADRMPERARGIDGAAMDRGAVQARGEVLSPDEPDGFRMAVKSDAFV